MAWNVEIDEEQEFKFIKPIFDALIKNNASMDLMKQVFYDTAIPRYFQYLPPTLKNDIEFLQECLKRDLISVGDIPENLQNQGTISRELYLINTATSFTNLEKNIYPQDDEIVLAALKGSPIAYYHIQDEFKNNSVLMIKALVANPELFNFLKEDIQKEFLGNEALIKESLKTSPSIFNCLSQEQKTNSEILKSTLETDKGYSLCKDYLRTNRDPQVALMALKFDDGARKKIHQMYSSILKSHKISTNCYSFLKIYLDQQNLESKLEQKDAKSSINKVKI